MVVGVDDVLTGAGIASNFLGGIMGNNSAKKAAKAQMEFQLSVLKNRHLWEVQDLRRAGLNPILSANGGGPGAPGASYTPQNVGAGVDSAITSASSRKLMAEQVLATNASAKASLATAANQLSQAKLNNVNSVNNSMLTPGLSFQAAIDNLKASAANPLLKKGADYTSFLSGGLVGGIDTAVKNLPTYNFPTNAKTSTPIVKKSLGSRNFAQPLKGWFN